MISEDRRSRDLAWCLHSPPLVVGESQQIVWPGPDWFAALPCSLPAATLPQPTHRHHFRLGQHFEATLAAWLGAQPGFELLAANLQVQDGKRTIGEFDFLVACEGRVEHWEAAVKFYLGTASGTELACWYGPNTADRFDIKYRRLIDHQLKLSANPYARALLAARHLDVSLTRCFMKGRLFHPWHRFVDGDFAAPSQVNPGHEKGWWMTRSEFLPTFEDSRSRFVYLPKSLWLAPLSAADFNAPLSCWELMEFLESPGTEQATHVAMVTAGGEESRGFIVDNQWVKRTS